MQRYFINENQINNNKVIITNGDYHHIKNVMRMKTGDKIIICPNNYRTFLVEITEILKQSIIGRIKEEIIENNEMMTKVTIALGFTKLSKQEEVVRRLVELGAYAYIPVIMARSNIKIRDNYNIKKERLERIVKEASEQSKRNILMKVHEPTNFSTFIDYSSEFDLRIVAYEEERNNKELSLLLKNNKLKNVLVLVGPEGGINKEEIEVLKDNYFNIVGLGKRILRCETAPLYLMSVIAFSLEK